jgi:hypothetical protein
VFAEMLNRRLHLWQRDKLVHPGCLVRQEQSRKVQICCQMKRIRDHLETTYFLNCLVLTISNMKNKINKIAFENKSHRRAGATLDFSLSLKANKEMFEQNLNVSFLYN